MDVSYAKFRIGDLLKQSKPGVHLHELYSVAPIHRGPLFREIQYIANRPWLPNFPKAKQKKKKKKF